MGTSQNVDYCELNSGNMAVVPAALRKADVEGLPVLQEFKVNLGNSKPLV